jgi:hypothetical protein
MCNVDEIQSQAQEELFEGAQEASAGGDAGGAVSSEPVGAGEDSAGVPDVAGAGSEGEQPAFALDENGELHISDDVLADHFGKEPPEAPQHDAFGNEAAPQNQQQAPIAPEQIYSAADLAKAFMTNSIDMNRIPEGVKEYYQAIMKEQQERQELQQIAAPQPQQQRMIPHPGNPPQRPNNQTFEINREAYKALRDGGKLLAAKYLGIDAGEFDEYNQQHNEALTTAMAELKERAQAIQRQNDEQAYNQNLQRWQQHAQAFQQQQQAIRGQQLQGMVNEFKKNPDWQNIDKNFYPKWYGALDNNSKAAIQQVMQSGNTQKMQEIMKVVFDAYAKAKPQNRINQAGKGVKVKNNPPNIMSGGSESDFSEQRGIADASKLEEMTPEQRGAWFVKQGLV